MRVSVHDYYAGKSSQILCLYVITIKPFLLQYKLTGIVFFWYTVLKQDKENYRPMKELFIKYKEIILYIIVGGLTTLVNWIVYAPCTHLLPIKTEGQLVLVSNIIAWVASILFAYFANKMWVFKSKTKGIKELTKEFTAFVGARLLTGIIEIIGVPFLVTIGLNQTLLGIEGAISKVVVSVVVIVLNYVFSKVFIFKKKA